MSGLLELAGKTALITGGARRLGAATALALADVGVNCVIHYHSSGAEARALRDILAARGVNVWLVAGDMADPNDARAVWDSAVDLAGPIDFLVNNASIFPENALDELRVDNLQENININTLAPAYLARYLAETGREGAIINFLDTMVRDYDKKHVPYHLSKKMLHDLTRMMAVEYAPRLRVNAVAPGLILPPEGKDESYLEGLKHSNPLQTFGCPEQVAHAVLFLLQNRFVTGQTIYIDGGRNLRGAMYE